MEIYRLETFCRLARALNFSRTAEELALSQSAVSRHIGALEQEFGMKLFARNGREVSLTEAGSRLLDYAERILNLVGEASRALAELKNLESGELWVGASTTPGNYLLGPVIAAYQKRYPGVELHLNISDSQSVLREVEEGALDVGVLGFPPSTAGVEIEPYVQDELALVMSPRHPLAGRPDIRVADLGTTRLLVREQGSHSRRTVEEHLRGKGFRPVQIGELGGTEAIKNAVAAGGGVAFLPRCATGLEIRSGMLVVGDGADCVIERQLVLAYPKGRRRTPAALAFAALLRKMRSGTEQTERQEVDSSRKGD